MYSDNSGIKNLIKSKYPSLKEQKKRVQDLRCQWGRAAGKMNSVTPSTGLKHAQFLVNLYSSYMGHDWAHHGWLLFLKMKEKLQQDGIFFLFFCAHFSLVGYWQMASQLWS